MIRIMKNIASLVIFYFLGIFFLRQKIAGKDILFYNSEKIGDLIVSSVILENDEKLCEGKEVYFLVKEKYLPLFGGYKGKIKIISYKHGLYKWFLPYRILLLTKLRKLKIGRFYNLTPARGMLNDEISLLSGAGKIYATCNDNKYLKGTGERTLKLYDGILFPEIKNEYVKHTELMKMSGIPEDEILFENRKTFILRGDNYRIYKNEIRKNEYIVVSPLSSEPERSWGTENFRKLCSELSARYKIVLTGSEKEKKYLEVIRDNNENIITDTSSLGELPSLIEHCRVFIGGDSGLTHIALKLGKPLLAVLDGGYFNRYFPYRIDDKRNNYIYKMMDCFECGFDCIYNKKLCITEIRFEDVLEKVKNILKDTG